MKTALLCLTASFLFCTATSLHAQYDINITGKNCKGSVLSANARGGVLTSLEWKLNGSTIATVKCSHDAVTVAGGHGEGNGANQLDDPNGVFVDDKGNIWIADTHNGRIQKFAPGADSGKTVGANLPNAPSSPTNVFVTDDGTVYVADYFASRVKKLTKYGKKWIDVAGQNDEMKLTRGVWVDKDGNVYATDCGNSRVLKYAPNSCVGNVVAGGNGFGSRTNQLARPVSVVLDDAKNIYVTEELNQRVTKWLPGSTHGIIVAGNYDTTGVTDTLEGLKGKGGVNNPIYGFVTNSGGSTGITGSDKSVRIFLSDKQANRVQLWFEGATNGIVIAGGNGRGDDANQLNRPFANCVAGNFLYVADRDNARIQKFSLGGNDVNTQFTADRPGTYTVTATFSNGVTVESSAMQVSGDCDQSFAVSSALVNEKDLNSPAVVFPNPAKNTVTIHFAAKESGKYVVELTEYNGKVISHKEVNAQAGLNTTNMDISRYSKGIYFITVIDADKNRQTIKLTKE